MFHFRTPVLVRDLLLIQRELPGVPLGETLVMERDEESPYRGFALVFALAVGVSIWTGLISVVLRLIS